MAHSITRIVLDPTDFDYVSAAVVDDLDGNHTVVSLAGGDVTLSAHGDGANVLADGLRLLADRVEAAHRDWLRTKKAEVYNPAPPGVWDIDPQDGE